MALRVEKPANWFDESRVRVDGADGGLAASEDLRDVDVVNVQKQETLIRRQRARRRRWRLSPRRRQRMVRTTPMEVKSTVETALVGIVVGREHGQQRVLRLRSHASADSEQIHPAARAANREGESL